MGAVATMAKDSTLRDFETIVDKWGETVFLIKRKDRDGNLAYSLRMTIGELRPWRFGPYRTEREAYRFMTKLTTPIAECAADIPTEMCGALKYAANEEW